MYTINITIINNPLLVAALILLGAVSVIRIVRWVLDILP